VLLPLLRTRGERALDLLVLSHRDTDHTGGAASLLRHWPVMAVTSSLEPGHPLRALMPHHTPCTAGTAWTWDGVRFTLLHPQAQTLAAANNEATTTNANAANANAAEPARDRVSTAPGPRLKPNALSCVLRVQDAGGRSVLLAGDIEAAQEAALVARDPQALHADLLLVPHHGSKTSSTPAFLAAVAPHSAFVQAGYRNRFGHPAPPVVARYGDAGITLLRSDRCGAWTWDGDTGRCERDVARRYWQTF
jgi:competence protein ComEC